MGQKKHLDTFIIFYEDMKHNLRQAVINIAYFFGVELSQDHLQCVIDNNKGRFYRPSSDLSPRILEDKKTREAIATIKNMTAQCLSENWCATSGSKWHI